MLKELRDRILRELALDEDQKKNNPSASALNMGNANTMKNK